MLERADQLPEADLLDLYERLVAELEGVPVGNTRADRRLQERAGALRALAAVRDELRLEPGERLTVKAFNRAAPGRVPGWNASRVVRAWGSWRNAADVLAGAKPPRRAERDAVSLVRGFRRSSHRPPLDGLLEWLRSTPSQRGQHAYDAWARAVNATLAPDKQRYLGSAGVVNAMAVGGFAVARRHAEAILNDREPPPIEGFHAAGRSLLRFTDIAREFSMSYMVLYHRVRETPLPAPVLHHTDRTFWLREDVEQWAHGETVTRRPGELDATVLDGRRLAEKLGIKPYTAQRRAMHQPHLIPEPAGELAGRSWWHVATVERWQAEAAQRQERGRERGDDRLVLDGRTFITTAAAREILDLTPKQFGLRQRRYGWRPTVRLGRVSLWLLDDIQAWRDAPDTVCAPCDLQDRILTSAQLARLHGVDLSSIRNGLQRGMTKYPPRDGIVSGVWWWSAERVARWRAEHPDDE